MSGPLDAYDIPEPANLPAAQRPASLSDVWRASRDLAAGDVSVAPFRRDRAAWEPVLDALGLHASQNPAYYDNGRFGSPTKLKAGGTFFPAYVGRDEQEELILARVRERRARDPNFLRDVPDTVAGFRQWVIDAEKTKRAGARSVLERSPGGLVAGAVELGAGAVEGFTDPINIMTLPVGGGGKTLGGILLRETLVNAGLEAAQQPLVALNRRELGEELTIGEAATNVTLSGLFGGVLETGATAAGRGISRGLEAATPLEKRLAAALDDAELPAIAREAIGWESLTPDQRAAVNVIERENEIAQSSPFAKGGPSLESHADRLAAAMEAVATATPRQPRDFGAPAGARPIETRLPSTALSGMDTLMQRIRTVESGGRVDAQNPRSSASGLYQFTDSTFLRLYKRRYGSGDRDFTILTRKNRPQLQEQLMRDLTQENAQTLARAGQAETAGNLYLAHFAGAKGALRILKADPDVPVERVMEPAAIEANPFLRGKTAGEVVAWAHKKMGEPGFGGQRVALARDGFPQGDYGEAMWRAVQAELDADAMARVAAERAQANVGQDAAPYGANLEVEPIDVDLRPWAREEDGEIPAAADAPTPPSREVLELLPRIRGAIDQDGVSLDPAKLAKRLGTTEELARQTLDLAAAQGSGLVRGRGGGWRRAMRRREPSDIVTFIADGGGIRDELNIRGEYGAHDMSERFRVMVPGAGPLHRKSGKSLDEWGEALLEAGWFTERPTTADVLDLIERGVMAYGGPKAKRVYRPDERSDIRIDIERSEAEQELIDRLADHLGTREINASDEFVEQLAERFNLRAGEDFADAADRAIAEEANSEIETAVRQSEPAHLTDYDDPFGPAAQAQLDVLRHDLADVDDGLPYMIDDGREGSLADLLAEVDEEKSFAAALRGCL
jgi:hypothetical protein